jgi:hypothetical protein
MGNSQMSASGIFNTELPAVHRCVICFSSELRSARLLTGTSPHLHRVVCPLIYLQTNLRSQLGNSKKAHIFIGLATNWQLQIQLKLKNTSRSISRL